MALDNRNCRTGFVIFFSFLCFSIWLFSPQPVGAWDHPFGQLGSLDSGHHGSHVSKKDNIKKFWFGLYGPGHRYGNAEAACRMEFESDLLAKAKSDECFYGPADPRNLPSFVYPGNLTHAEKAECIAGDGQPKVNQAYVWGLVKSGHNLWFGTIANTLCLVLNPLLAAFSAPSTALNNTSWVCGETSFGLLGPSGLKDYRPPRVFYYDLEDRKLHEVTQKIIDKGGLDVTLLETTGGLRSAGAARGVVYLGGVGAGGGVNIFAFDARTKNYLGSRNYPQYNNIRQWRNVIDELYVGMGKTGGGGDILRWTGTPASPFAFEIVGGVGGDPAYLTEHEGRLFVSIWPAISLSGSVKMSIWMSPEFGPDGKLPLSTALWTNVWDITKYEPEPAVQATIAGGALMSYQGHLYWGTMLVPGTSFLAWQSANPTASSEDVDAALLATYRPITIFRGKNFGKSSQKVELLYGSKELPKYENGDWKLVPNNLGQKPKYGPAGFGNFFNTYTWWMEVYKDQLFVGTFDFSYVVAAGVEGVLGVDFPEMLDELAEKFYGADLWRFCSDDRPAGSVSLNGVDNFTNYGIRTMVSTEDSLYLGSANAMNLLTDPREPRGGWELIELEAQGRWKFGDRWHR